MEFEELKCPNCREFFDTSTGKIPRLLINCGHSLCEICINEKLLIKDDNGLSTISCIEDDEVYPGIKSVDQFPKNMTLIKLLNKKHGTTSLLNSNNKAKVKGVSFSSIITCDQLEPDQGNTLVVNTTENKKNELLTTPASKAKHEQHESSTDFTNQIGDITSCEFNLVSDEYTTIHNVDKAKSRKGSKHESALNNLDIIQNINKSSLRLGLLKHDSRLIFNQDKQDKQGNQNGSDRVPTEEPAFCQEHANRRLELICLEDKKKICTNCALFGNHKKHNVISEEDFIKEIEVKAEILIELFELIDNYSSSIRDKRYMDKFRVLMEKSKQRSEAITRQVKDFIQELISNIKKSEHDIVNNILKKKFEPINAKIQAVQEIPNEILAKADEWQHQVQIKLDKLTEINDSSGCNGFSNEELAKLIDINVTNQETISHAEEISNEFEKALAIPTHSIEDMISNLSVEFNYELALKLNNIVHIVNSQEIELEKDVLNIDDQQIKETKDRKNTREESNKSSHQRSVNNFINNTPNMNNNYSMQSIATTTSETIGNYFAGGENESIKANNSGNHSFLNLSEDSAIIRMNTVNANVSIKNTDLNKAKEIPGVKHRNSLTTISCPSVNTSATQLKINPTKAKPALYNSNISTNPHLNTNNPNNLISFNPNQSVIKPANKTERSDLNSRLSPGRDEEHSKSPTPDRDKIVFIKSQMKNEVANFTGYDIGEVGTKILADILASAYSTSKSSNPYKAKEIKLTKTNLNDESAFYIFKSLEMNTNVLTLNIAKNHLTDRCIEAVVSLLSKNKILKTIYLSNNNFSALAKDRIKSYGAGGKFKIFI